MTAQSSPHSRNPDARFQPAAAITWRDIPGEIALFDTETGVYFALNKNAAEIWRGLAQGQSAQVVSEALSARFDADAATLWADVAEFITYALDRGILVPMETP